MRLFKTGLAVLIFGVALLSWGQTAPAPNAGGAARGHAARRQMHLLQRLDLTADQQNQVRNLFQSQRQKVQSVRQDTSLNAEQKQQQIQEIRQSTHQQMLAILTPEQQAKLKQMQERRRGLESLNLTPDQRSKIMPIREQMHREVMAVRQDSSLSAEQKRDKIRDIRQNAWAQMKNVLTPEQQQQWEQMRQRRGRPGPLPAPEGL
jgi:Spy/CpxP family protein refolding chaperone